MSPEELDLAIENLLEERPNEEKPKRRRRNKFKDLKKKVLRNEPIITDAMVYELVDKEIFTRTIETMDVHLIESELTLGIVNGWYDDIDEIADYFDVDKRNIRLEKISDYGYDEEGESWSSWDGDARVLLNVLELRLYFLDNNNEIIARKGSNWRPHYVEKPDFVEGNYIYDDEAVQFTKEHFGSAPQQRVTRSYTFNQFKYNPGELFRNDTKGKYKVYQQVLKEHSKTNFWSKTVPVDKCKNNGTKNRLINMLNYMGRGPYGNIDYYINASIRNDQDDYYGYFDELVMEFEQGYHDVFYEYVW